MLSTAHLDTCPHPVTLDLPHLAEDLEQRLPEAVFAFALGSSAKTGVVRARGDLDLAVYLVPGAAITIDVQRQAEETVREQTDAGIPVLQIHSQYSDRASAGKGTLPCAKVTPLHRETRDQKA